MKKLNKKQLIINIVIILVSIMFSYFAITNKPEKSKLKAKELFV